MNEKYKNIIKKSDLKKYYLNQKLSSINIAKIYQCNYTTVLNYLKKFNIKIRTSKEQLDLQPNQNKGRIFSKEHKQNISKNHADVSGKNNGNHKHGETLKQHYCIAPNCNNKICYNNWTSGKGHCVKCYHKSNKGKNHYLFGKQIHGKWGKYKNIWMRSSWEIKFAFFLDKSNIKWKYEPIAFDLGYTTYTPDFYIKEWDCYIEIKGWWRDDAKEKFKLFKKLYPKENIKVFVKINLEKIGVL